VRVIRTEYTLPTKGQWEGDTLVFQRQMPMGFSRYSHRVAESVYFFKMEMSQDGERWQTMLEGRYEKQ
jgi:hypothetical protein